MKTIKRAISTALLLCIMAALFSVSASAEIFQGDKFVVSGPIEVDGNAGPDQIYNYTATLTRDGHTVDSKDVVWYKNGINVKEDMTDESGRSTASFTANGLNNGDVLYATVTLGTDILTSNSLTITKTAVNKTTTLSLNAHNITLEIGEEFTLVPTVDGVADSNKVTWSVLNPSVLSIDENGKITALAEGTTTVTAYAKDNSVAQDSCTVHVIDTSETVISIQPIVSELKKNQVINIRCDVTSESGARFDYWRIDGASQGYYSIANDSQQSTTLKALNTTSFPVRLYAHADDGTSTYIEFSIVPADSLQLEAYPSSIKNGETSSVYIANAMANEQFTWTVTPSANYGVLASSRNLGTSVELTAGPVEGRITVTATSKSDATRTASTTVYVNSEAAFGSASIKPSIASWSAGQGNLLFEVRPAFYAAYLDGKLLTPASGYYTYYNNVLTLKPSLLSSLSSGEHSLKVYTSEGKGADGLVYATIYINGSASSVYGDNAHVRGSSYNLYFTSTDPIKEVYISNQWIDPANYTLDPTGTRLTLKSDFLNKLGYGSYTMKLVTQNGYTETASFRIVTANYAPATGDNSNVGAWVMLMLISAAGAVALIPRKKSGTDLIG